jgi:hypothetical protein
LTCSFIRLYHSPGPRRYLPAEAMMIVAAAKEGGS